MSSDLRERLEDLATHTPAAIPPTDLWDRGVRRRRLDVAVTVSVVLMLVALVGLGGLTWHASRPVQPTDARGAPHLPDRFYVPSPWLRTFDGPPGPLVTIISAQQKSVLHTRDGLVGVTASGGTYGFLDLPVGAVLKPNIDSGWALSPDGGRVAFWTSGTPSGRPNTEMEDGATITGIGTYDARTGRVRTSEIPTRHGLDPSLLLWADDDTLSFTFGQIVGGDGSKAQGGTASLTSHYVGRYVWPTDSPRPTAVPGGEAPLFLENATSRASSGSLVGPSTRRRAWWLMPADGRTRQSFHTSAHVDLLVPSPDLERVVAVPGARDHGFGRLAIASLPSRDAGPDALARFRDVDGAHSAWFRPVTWLDRHHVAALRRVIVHGPDGDVHVGGELDSVDLRTGATRRLMEEADLSTGSVADDATLATGLLSAPVVAAVPPSDPWNRRGVAIGLVVGAALLGLLVWGTRVRRA